MGEIAIPDKAAFAETSGEIPFGQRYEALWQQASNLPHSNPGSSSHPTFTGSFVSSEHGGPLILEIGASAHTTNITREKATGRLLGRYEVGKANWTEYEMVPTLERRCVMVAIRDRRGQAVVRPQFLYDGDLQIPEGAELPRARSIHLLESHEQYVAIGKRIAAGEAVVL